MRNAPAAINQGFEIETLWLATDALQLGLSYSYSDATYTQELIDPITGGIGIIFGSNALAPLSVYSIAERRIPLKGERLLHIPKHKASAFLKYRWLFSRGNLDLVTSWSWIDEIAFQLSNSPLDVAPAWSRWDARLNWSSADSRLNISLFVNNILDEIGVRDIWAGDERKNYYRTVTPTIPRFAGIDIRYRFGAY